MNNIYEWNWSFISNQKIYFYCINILRACTEQVNAKKKIIIKNNNDSSRYELYWRYFFALWLKKRKTNKKIPLISYPSCCTLTPNRSIFALYWLQKHTFFPFHIVAVSVRFWFCLLFHFILSRRVQPDPDNTVLCVKSHTKLPCNVGYKSWHSANVT